MEIYTPIKPYPLRVKLVTPDVILYASHAEQVHETENKSKTSCNDKRKLEAYKYIVPPRKRLCLSQSTEIMAELNGTEHMNLVNLVIHQIHRILVPQDISPIIKCENVSTLIEDLKMVCRLLKAEFKCTFMYATIYYMYKLSRAVKSDSTCLSNLAIVFPSIRSMWYTALVLAYKMWEDNASITKTDTFLVLGWKPALYTKRERLLLSLLDYQLFVPIDAFKTHLNN